MNETTRFTARPAPRLDERELEAVEDLADDRGFVDRSPAKRVRKRERFRGKVHNLSLRVTVDDADDFVAWCESERMTYREGFARMVAAVVNRT